LTDVRTLILGIGNSILGDDGIGVCVAQELSAQIKNENIDVRDVSVDGLNLLEIIIGYDKLVVVDAIMTKEGEVGDIYRLKPERIGDPSRSAISPHHFNLATTLEIGKKLFPNEMPEEVIVYAVKAEDVTGVTEKMTKKMMEAVPEVVRLVIEELDHTEMRVFSSKDSICVT
jgi:hydrogenase maturation protease